MYGFIKVTVVIRVISWEIDNCNLIRQKLFYRLVRIKREIRGRVNYRKKHTGIASSMFEAVWWGCWTSDLVVTDESPLPYYSLDLFTFFPKVDSLTRFVYSQLVCPLLVGIFKTLWLFITAAFQFDWNGRESPMGYWWKRKRWHVCSVLQVALIKCICIPFSR